MKMGPMAAIRGFLRSRRETGKETPAIGPVPDDAERIESMCFKAGNDELDTVKNLMLMALRAAIAQALDVEMDELEPEQRLVEDLAMDAEKQAELVELIADTFDGLTLDLDALETIGQIYEAVVLEEFRDLEAQAAATGELAA